MIPGISSCLSFLQSRYCWGRFLHHHKPQKLQPTEGMSLRSSCVWARLRGLWLCGRQLRLWQWGMLAYLLGLPRSHDWKIVYHGIHIVSPCIYNFTLANCLRFFAIIVILILLLILLLLLLMFLFFIIHHFIFLFIVTVPFHIHITA